MAQKNLYEILVPTVRSNGRPIRTRCHKQWDEQVRKISGGLTILNPAKGQWISPNGELFDERMIPVRIMCSADEMKKIATMTLAHYDQIAVMYYRISSDVTVLFDKSFQPV